MQKTLPKGIGGHLRHQRGEKKIEGEGVLAAITYFTEFF